MLSRTPIENKVILGREITDGSDKDPTRCRIFCATMEGVSVILKKIYHPDPDLIKSNPLHPKVQALYPDYYKGYYIENTPGYICYIYKDCGTDVFELRRIIEEDNPRNARRAPDITTLIKIYSLALGILHETICMHKIGITNGDIKLENFAATLSPTGQYSVTAIDLENVGDINRRFHMSTEGYFKYNPTGAKPFQHTLEQDYYALAVTMYLLAFWTDGATKLKAMERATNPSKIFDTFFTPPTQIGPQHHYRPFIKCALRLAKLTPKTYSASACYKHLHKHQQRLMTPPAGKDASDTTFTTTNPFYKFHHPTPIASSSKKKSCCCIL